MTCAAAVYTTLATSWTGTAAIDIPWIPNSNYSIRIFAIILKDTTGQAAPLFASHASWGPTLCWAGLPASRAALIPIPYIVPIAASPCNLCAGSVAIVSTGSLGTLSAILSLPAEWA